MGTIQQEYFLPLEPAYRRGAGLQLGDPVTVVLMPEVHRAKLWLSALSPALAAEPENRLVYLTGLQRFIARTTCGGLMRRSAAPVCALNGSPSCRVDEGRQE